MFDRIKQLSESSTWEKRFFQVAWVKKSASYNFLKNTKAQRTHLKEGFPGTKRTINNESWSFFPDKLLDKASATRKILNGKYDVAITMKTNWPWSYYCVRNDLDLKYETLSQNK